MDFDLNVLAETLLISEHADSWSESEKPRDTVAFSTCSNPKLLAL